MTRRVVPVVRLAGGHHPEVHEPSGGGGRAIAARSRSAPGPFAASLLSSRQLPVVMETKEDRPADGQWRCHPIRVERDFHVLGARGLPRRAAVIQGWTRDTSRPGSRREVRAGVRWSAHRCPGEYCFCRRTSSQSRRLGGRVSASALVGASARPPRTPATDRVAARRARSRDVSTPETRHGYDGVDGSTGDFSGSYGRHTYGQHATTRSPVHGR